MVSAPGTEPGARSRPAARVAASGTPNPAKARALGSLTAEGPAPPQTLAGAPGLFGFPGAGRAEPLVRPPGITGQPVGQ